MCYNSTTGSNFEISTASYMTVGTEITKLELTINKKKSTQKHEKEKFSINTKV